LNGTLNWEGLLLIDKEAIKASDDVITAEDGAIYIDGMRMYKHILFHCADGKRTVQGFLLSGNAEMNTARQEIMFVADNDPIQQTINEGWQLDSGGNWTPPEISETTAKADLECDIAEIECQLHLLKEYEEKAEWLGVTPYSDECDAVLSPPVHCKPEIPQAPKFCNLFEAFQSLAEQSVASIEAAVMSVPIPKKIPKKAELVTLLKEKRRQLSRIKK
jgi:hypothetical protein